MRENALRNSAPCSTISLPEYSGHRRTWMHPRPSERALATGRLRSHRQPRKIGRWIFLAAAGAAAVALLKGSTC